jgi:hypothetical protein
LLDYYDGDSIAPSAIVTQALATEPLVPRLLFLFARFLPTAGQKKVWIETSKSASKIKLIFKSFILAFRAESQVLLEPQSSFERRLLRDCEHGRYTGHAR